MSAPLLRPLLGAAALLLAGGAAAVPAPVALHGSVRELGEGAAEVRISATCLATGEVTRTRSGAGGGYAFDALAPCAYWIEAHGEATRSAQRITLRAGQSVALDLALYPEVATLQPMVVVGLRDERTAQIRSDATVVQIDPAAEAAPAATAVAAAPPAAAPASAPRVVAAAPAAPARPRAPAARAAAWNDPLQVDRRAVAPVVWRGPVKARVARPKPAAAPDRLRWFVGVEGRVADPARVGSFLGTPLIGSVAWSPADGALPSLNVDSGATGNLIELIGTFRVGLAYAW